MSGAADLSPGQNKRLRDAMQRLMNEDARYGNKSRLAAALGRKQPSISDFLNGRTGASHETAERLARLMQVDVRELLGEREAASPPVPEDELVYEHDDRYPNRGRAIAAARLLRKDERAIASVGDVLPAADMPVQWWFRRIELIEEDLTADLVPVAAYQQTAPITRDQLVGARPIEELSIAPRPRHRGRSKNGLGTPRSGGAGGGSPPSRKSES